MLRTPSCPRVPLGHLGYVEVDQDTAVSMSVRNRRNFLVTVPGAAYCSSTIDLYTIGLLIQVKYIP